MTIYDSDFTHELAAMEAQEKAQIPAVVDQVAEVSPAIEEQVQEQPVDQVQEEVSDKEYNFRALRDSVAELKAEREAERQRYQHELDSLRMQMQSQTPKQEPKRALDDQSDDDLLTVGKYRQTVREMQEQHQQELQQMRVEQEDMKARLQYQDYDEVMEKYSIPLLKNNRDFARAFQSSENKANFAYELGKMAMYKEQASQPVQEPVVQQQQKNAQRMVDNARKPGTLSQARGGQPNISNLERWASCSDEDFMKEVSKNLAEV